jgi:hypothetical protein
MLFFLLLLSCFQVNLFWIVWIDLNLRNPFKESLEFLAFCWVDIKFFGIFERESECCDANEWIFAPLNILIFENCQSHAPLLILKNWSVVFFCCHILFNQYIIYKYLVYTIHYIVTFLLFG